MAKFLYMNSKEILKFIKKVNVDEYNFVLVSKDITNEKGLAKNVISLPKLLPPPQSVAHVLDGKTKKFKKSYLNYLAMPKVDSLITVIAKMLAVENGNVVLVCSKVEDDEYQYLSTLADYIETLYDIKAQSYKEFKKDPDMNSVKNKKRTIQIVQTKLQNIDVGYVNETFASSTLRSKLEECSNKELRKLAKKLDIKLKEDMPREKVIKKILKSSL